MKFEKVEKRPERYPAIIACRCSAEDHALAKARAAETGNSLSAYARKRILGGRVSRPIQDFRDLNELRQHMGLLKTLVKDNKEFCPVLHAIEILIARMSAKAE